MHLDAAQDARRKKLETAQDARHVLNAIRETRAAQGRLDVEEETVRLLGRSHLLGIGREAAGFEVPTEAWQALLLVTVVIRPSREGSASFVITPSVALEHLQECIIPELQQPLPVEIEAKCRELDPTIVLPTDAIGAYLTYLAQANVLEPSSAFDGSGFNVASQEKVDLRRRIAGYLAGDRGPSR